jgi:hypothetical protein
MPCFWEYLQGHAWSLHSGPFFGSMHNYGIVGFEYFLLSSSAGDLALVRRVRPSEADAHMALSFMYPTFAASVPPPSLGWGQGGGGTPSNCYGKCSFHVGGSGPSYSCPSRKSKVPPIINSRCLIFCQAAQTDPARCCLTPLPLLGRSTILRISIAVDKYRPGARQHPAAAVGPPSLHSPHRWHQLVVPGAQAQVGPPATRATRRALGPSSLRQFRAA